MSETLQASLTRLFDAQESGHWAESLRRQGREQFDASGLPSPKEENWRGTNVTALGKLDFSGGGEQTPVLDHPLTQLDLGGPRFVFAGGKLVERSGDAAEGLWVGTLAEGREAFGDRMHDWVSGEESEFGSFEALNRAFLDSGVLVVASADHQSDQVVEIVYSLQSNGTPALQMPRTILVAEKGASLSVVETFVSRGESETLTNSVSRAIIGENAHIEHARLQLEGEQGWHVSTVTSRQQRDSRYTGHHFNLGAKLARHNTRAVLDGEGANCLLNGLYVASEQQHVDNDTVLDHAKPHCDSRELYKGILGGKARSVFTGRIIVREDAQKTDAKQSNPNLLLSPDALAQTRPQLEIYADDVKCTHGATIGQMDDDAIFYLQARGLSRAEAKRMLVHAIAGEVVDAVEVEPLRNALATEIDRRLTEMEG